MIDKEGGNKADPLHVMGICFFLPNWDQACKPSPHSQALLSDFTCRKHAPKHNQSTKSHRYQPRMTFKRRSTENKHRESTVFYLQDCTTVQAFF